MFLQRVDTEKSRHRTVITSDVRQQINEMNQKVKEEWEKKQAEAEKLKKPSEVYSVLIIYLLNFLLKHTDIAKFVCTIFSMMQSEEGDGGVDSEKEKEDNRSKGLKVREKLKTHFWRQFDCNFAISCFNL